MSANGTSDPNGVATVTTGCRKYARPGWNVALSAGAALATGAVAGVVELVY